MTTAPTLTLYSVVLLATLKVCNVESKKTDAGVWRADSQVVEGSVTCIVNAHDSLAVASVRAKADLEPAWCPCAHVVMLYAPTRHSTAKEASHRTVYRRSTQECVQLDLNHVIAEEYETRKCRWTAAASYDAELDRGDGICVAIFGPPKTYLPGPIITGGTVVLSDVTRWLMLRWRPVTVAIIVQCDVAPWCLCEITLSS